MCPAAHTWTSPADATRHIDYILNDSKPVVQDSVYHHDADVASHTRDHIPIAATLAYQPSPHAPAQRCFTYPGLRAELLLDWSFPDRVAGTFVGIPHLDWSLHPGDHHAATTEAMHAAWDAKPPPHPPEGPLTCA